MKNALILTAFATIAIIHIGQAAGFNLNLSASAPIGLWSKRPIPAEPRRGMFVWICPPPTVPLVKLFSDNGTLPYGSCPESNAGLLLKPIQALPGDTVRINHGHEVLVNGKPLFNTISSETLEAWPDGDYIVQPGEVWVFSSYSNKSFDSRYFGPVSMNLVKGEAVPLLAN